MLRLEGCDENGIVCKNVLMETVHSHQQLMILAINRGEAKRTSVNIGLSLYIIKVHRCVLLLFFLFLLELKARWVM